MSSQLPRCVSANTEFPVYYIRTSAKDVTGLRYVPFLPPNSGWRWAEDFEVASPHIVLTPRVAAELLCLAPDVPVGMSDASAVAAIDFVLAAHGCDLDACICDLAQAYGDHPDATAARMSRCIAVASRLCGVRP